MFTISSGLAFLASVALVQGAPQSHVQNRNGVIHNIVEDAELGAKMDFVANSGICETTPGVKQYSGYFSVGSNMNMFFWFFEARNDPAHAPLSTWFNGGPGCSSMIGLMQENGPCNFPNNQSEPALNPYSFNEYANMLYIDQPIGVGFSYGTDSVDSTVTAAPQVWKLIQAFYEQFPEYESRDFAVFTESYGGHYGPEFSDYILQQNDKIAAGSVSGEKINMKALGINNGLYDAAILYKSYIDFSYSNKYNQIIDADKRDSYNQIYEERCAPLLEQCTSTTSTSQTNACVRAQRACQNDIEGAIQQEADFDVYDVREPSNDPYPPSAYLDYLNRPEVQQAIGAKPTNFEMCSDSAGESFYNTGDNSRSFLPTLSDVVQRGVQTLIWHGDADWICNYINGFNSVNQINYSGHAEFNSTELKPYTVNGEEQGLFKTVDNLSYIQVYGAGHEVPYYRPELALQAFKQTMMGKPVSGT